MGRRDVVKGRRDVVKGRRDEGTLLRDEGTLLRDEGTLLRDEGTLLRDEGTLLRDEGTLLRDEGTLLRDEGTLLRDEGTLLRCTFFRMADDDHMLSGYSTVTYFLAVTLLCAVIYVAYHYRHRVCINLLPGCYFALCSHLRGLPLQTPSMYKLTSWLLLCFVQSSTWLTITDTEYV